MGLRLALLRMASKGVCLKMVTGQHPKPCKTCNSVAVLYIARYEFSPNQQYHAYTVIYIWIYDSGGCICNVAITYKPNQHVSLGYMIVAVGRWMMVKVPPWESSFHQKSFQILGQTTCTPVIYIYICMMRKYTMTISIICIYPLHI